MMYGKKIPMEVIHREARLIDIERRVRIDELNQLLKQKSGRPNNFRLRAQWRAELIQLHSMPI